MKSCPKEEEEREVLNRLAPVGTVYVRHADILQPIKLANPVMKRSVRNAEPR